ncbi:MAG: adenylate/guanylate cyclase domain-containing protein [Bacteroidetes bacterium]|nr:adenylate/guanylate cyclase domain-containing protein [Bacteroidota bacterium]
MARTSLSTAAFRERQRTFTFRHPILMNMATQIVFWVVANLLLVLLVWALLHAASFHAEGLRMLSLQAGCFIALVLGVLYGAILGVIDQLLERTTNPARTWGFRILLKAVLYTGTSVLLVMLFYRATMPVHERYMGGTPASEGRLWLGTALVLYAMIGNVAVSFFKEVERSFGPGTMRPLILGLYRQPQVEDRVFMFMDLRGSTTLAESLGHLRYSAMVRDLFQEVNREVPRHLAEIYQYVGDEVVLTWDRHAGPDAQRCLKMFFAVQDRIQARAAFYHERYGLVPQFKAGVHAGQVTAVEIGDIKREIAYHGDTINTAARIQGKSNEFGHLLLVSREMIMLCGDIGKIGMRSEALGGILLKGKKRRVDVYAVERLPTHGNAN